MMYSTTIKPIYEPFLERDVELLTTEIIEDFKKFTNNTKATGLKGKIYIKALKKNCEDTQFICNGFVLSNPMEFGIQKEIYQGNLTSLKVTGDDGCSGMVIFVDWVI